MLVAGEIEEQGDAEEQVQDNVDDAAQGADTAVSGDDVQDQSIPSPTSPTLPTPPPQQPQDLPSTSQEALDACAALTRRVEHLEHDKVAQALEITKQKKRVKKLERPTRDTGVALMDDEATKKKAKDAQVVAAISESVNAASAAIAAVPAATITDALVRVAAASTRRRKGVVIRDSEEESSAKIPAETKSKDKGKGIMDIDWSAAIDHVKQKPKEDSYVQRYQVIKKRPRTEAQARRNMIMYLKNVVGFRLDYFKGMSYDDIRPIFEAKFNSNIEFLLKSKEQIEEE
nr:hypothetical protein [Tanacetum cinerariifolium]